MFGWFAQRDAVQQAARKYAPMLVKYRRKNPDKPFYPLLQPVVPMLKHLLKEDWQRDLLTMISAPEYQVNRVQDLCSALVAIETEIPPGDSERYQHVVDCVQKELRQLEFQEAS